jgi:hypothetical protein
MTTAAIAIKFIRIVLFVLFFISSGSPIKFIIAKVQTSEQNTKLALVFYGERGVLFDNCSEVFKVFKVFKGFRGFKVSKDSKLPKDLKDPTPAPFFYCTRCKIIKQA